MRLAQSHRTGLCGPTPRSKQLKGLGSHVPATQSASLSPGSGHARGFNIWLSPKKGGEKAKKKSMTFCGTMSTAHTCHIEYECLPS